MMLVIATIAIVGPIAFSIGKARGANFVLAALSEPKRRRVDLDKTSRFVRADIGPALRRSLERQS
jgi:hypothetical protein